MGWMKERDRLHRPNQIPPNHQPNPTSPACSQPKDDNLHLVTIAYN